MREENNFYQLEVSSGDYSIEDLFQIYLLLKSISEEVSIKTERYEFDSFEEFRKFDGFIKRIYFSIPEPFISVEIDQSVKIFTNKDIPLTRSIIEQIGVLAKDKAIKNRAKFLMNIRLVIIAAIGTVLFVLLKDQPIIRIGFVTFCYFLIASLFYTIRRSNIKPISN